jgi:hypothetical protein
MASRPVTVSQLLDGHVSLDLEGSGGGDVYSKSPTPDARTAT